MINNITRKSLFFVCLFLLLANLIFPFSTVRASPPASVRIHECKEGKSCRGEDVAPSSSMDVLWWIDNAFNQIAPDTYKTAGEVITNPYNTCGPTTLAMVINYYRSRSNDGLETVTPSDVILKAAEMGLYTAPYVPSGLLGLPNLREIAGKFGFQQAYPEDRNVFIHFDDLIEQLKYGRPAIVGMRYDYDKQTGAYLPVPASDQKHINHFVIAFGLSTTDDGETLVWVLNTHPGRNMTENSDVLPTPMSTEVFKASWARNDDSSLSDYGFVLFIEPVPAG